MVLEIILSNIVPHLGRSLRSLTILVWALLWFQSLLEQCFTVLVLSSVFLKVLLFWLNIFSTVILA